MALDKMDLVVCFALIILPFVYFGALSEADILHVFDRSAKNKAQPTLYIVPFERVKQEHNIRYEERERRLNMILLPQLEEDPTPTPTPPPPPPIPTTSTIDNIEHLLPLVELSEVQG